MHKANSIFITLVRI